jgi:hypothetical protein
MSAKRGRGTARKALHAIRIIVGDNTAIFKLQDESLNPRKECLDRARRLHECAVARLARTRNLHPAEREPPDPAPQDPVPMRIFDLPEPVMPEADFTTGVADLSESDFSRFSLSDFQGTRFDFMGPCFHPDGDSGSM